MHCRCKSACPVEAQSNLVEQLKKRLNQETVSIAFSELGAKPTSLPQKCTCCNITSPLEKLAAVSSQHCKIHRVPIHKRFQVP